LDFGFWILDFQISELCNRELFLVAQTAAQDRFTVVPPTPSYVLSSILKKAHYAIVELAQEPSPRLHLRDLILTSLHHLFSPLRSSPLFIQHDNSAFTMVLPP
jgi:hypothetical protein